MREDFDALDPRLLRMFAAAGEPAADEAFMETLLLKIEQARRVRLRRQLLAMAAAVMLVLLNLRWVLENTGAMVRRVGDLSPLSNWLITPWGWAASLVLGAALLLRFRPSRR